MRDYISKWWNRKWSSWEYEGESEWYCYILLKRTSNDGLVQFKRINTRG